MAGDLAPGLGDDGVDGALRDGVSGNLIRAEDGFKLADEVGGTDDLFASERRNSMVPASTMETYMMSLLGEYCMAMRRKPASMASRPAWSSCQLE